MIFAVLARRDQLALSIDLAPTLLELAGVKWPGTMHGQSLLPAVADAKAPGRASMLTEYFQEKVGPRVPDWQSVRTQRLKYIHYPTLENMDELYDLARDPHEMNNLVGEPSAQAERAQLAAELERLLAATR